MDVTGRPITRTHKPIAGSCRAFSTASPARSPAACSFNCEWASHVVRDTGDATMDEQPTQPRDQQERPAMPQPSSDGLPATHPFPESHSLGDTTATTTARSGVYPPHGTQSPRHGTQTPSRSRTMALQRRAAVSSLRFEEQARADTALLPSTGTPHWATALFPHARFPMWNPDNNQPSQSQSRSPRPENRPSSVPTQQQQTGVDAAAFAPSINDGRIHSIPSTAQVDAVESQPVSTMASQAQQEREERKSDDMEIDVLLDDASLDMLVTTLARETARIEAATNQRRQSVLHWQHQEDDEHDDDEDEDNQRSEQDHGHGDDSDFSSGDSSNPSTPSTSSSGVSALQQPGKGKGKTKPKRVRRACVIPGCGKRSRSLGLCIAHGGGRRCAVNGCDKSSQGGNLCIKHGGGKRCSVDGCEKAAQTNHLCKAHGGGPRCQFGDCQKSSQGGGFCRQHGGGKRCAFEGCMKGTQRGSYCALHGGSRFCVVEGCRRNDRGGGFCAHHGGGRRCTVAGCMRPSRRNALCSTHLRVLGPDGGPSLEELNASIDQGMRLTLQATGSSSPSPAPSPSPPYPPERGAPPR